MLETAEGYVFETREGDIALAEYREFRYSTSGPVWIVTPMLRAEVDDLSERFYEGYARGEVKQ